MEPVHAAVNITNEEMVQFLLVDFPFEFAHSSKLSERTEQQLSNLLLGALALMPFSHLNHSSSAALYFPLRVSQHWADERLFGKK